MIMAGISGNDGIPGMNPTGWNCAGMEMDCANSEQFGRDGAEMGRKWPNCPPERAQIRHPGPTTECPEMTQKRPPLNESAFTVLGYQNGEMAICAGNGAVWTNAI